MEDELISVNVTVSHRINEKLESIMKQLGLRSKGGVIERILAEVFEETDQQGD